MTIAILSVSAGTCLIAAIVRLHRRQQKVQQFLADSLRHAMHRV